MVKYTFCGDFFDICDGMKLSKTPKFFYSITWHFTGKKRGNIWSIINIIETKTKKYDGIHNAQC